MTRMTKKQALRQGGVSTSPDQTQAFGREIGRLAKAPLVIALSGPLGAGKTTLVKGIAQGMGIPAEDVQSPSFVLIREYAGPRQWLYHADCYRLAGANVMVSLGLEEYINPRGILVIEWPRRGMRQLTEEYLEIRLSVAGRSTRKITLRAWGSRATALTAGLAGQHHLG